MSKIEFRHLKPAIVLGVITTLISALLVITMHFIPDTSNELTDTLRESCRALMGEGKFELSEDKPDEVNKLIKKDDGKVAFEITTGGYKPPDGITALVAMDTDGSVLGVTIVTFNDDPIANGVKEQDFLSRFVGVMNTVEIVKNPPKSDDEVMAITGATYSSKGVAEAVNIAIEVYGGLS